MLIAVWETALVLAVGLAASEGLLCPRGASWWNAQKSSCILCTLCEAPLLVLRPCAPHQDTVCANLEDLQLDWTFLRKPKPHSHRKPSPKERNGSGDGSLTLDEEGSGSTDQDIILDDDEDYVRGNDVTGLHALPDYDYEAVRDDRNYFVSVNSDDRDAMAWEPIVLSLAIAICFLFTVLVCVFSVYFTRQWRLIKKRLEDGELFLLCSRLFLLRVCVGCGLLGIDTRLLCTGIGSSYIVDLMRSIVDCFRSYERYFCLDIAYYL